MTVYAVTHQEDAPDYITPGKRYEALEGGSAFGFNAVADNGNVIYCSWKGSSHLNGGSWERIEMEDSMQDWIKHDGSECPVPKGTLVDVKHRDGEEFVSAEVGHGAATDWEHGEDDGDIMFYRIFDPITLAPGDYVSTKGMTEDQYHAVAKAFMAAGAEAGEYPCEQERKTLPYFGLGGYGIRDGKLCHAGRTGTSDGYWLNGRHLTPAQVIGATNGGNQQEEDTLTRALRYARDELANAEHCEAQAAEHRANHDGVMDRVRDMLPEGWRLVHDAEPAADMGDPANWREGDVVECVETIDDTKEGGLYTLEIDPRDGTLSFRDDAGDFCSIGMTKLCFHHRP